MSLLIETTVRSEWTNFLSKNTRSCGLMIFGESKENSHKYHGGIGSKAIELVNYSVENNVSLYFWCMYFWISVENKIVKIYV